MPKFYTAYNVPASCSEPPCPKERKGFIYDSVSECLTETETIPFYEEIQSYYESTRLDHKIEQFRRGNSLALGIPGGEYIDVSDVPTNLAQVLSSRDKARNDFYKLPEGIRNIFGNDYEQFVDSLQDGSYESKLTDYAKSISNPGDKGGQGTLAEPNGGAE